MPSLAPMSTVTRVPALPRLGWAARLTAGAWHVLTGADVEIGPDGDCWFEGAWAGSFDAWAFERADAVFGSGGAIEIDGTARFTGPTHPQEGLSVVRRGGDLVVANSIVLALWLSGARGHAPDPAHLLPPLPGGGRLR